jgi:hypothetical protein
MNLLPFKLILVLTNFSILSFLAVLIIEHFNSNSNIKSWSSVFHILCFCWLTIRGVFWLCTMTSNERWTAASFFFLYWIPTPLEFGSFMLLPLYFAQVLYRNQWKSYSKLIRPIYILLLTGLIVFQAVWAILSAIENNTKICKHDPCFHTEFSSNTFRGITAACFFFLTVAQAGYSIQVRILLVLFYILFLYYQTFFYSYCFWSQLYYFDRQRIQMFLIASNEILAMVNAILVISFSTRSLYQILAIFNIFILPDIPLQVD